MNAIRIVPSVARAPIARSFDEMFSDFFGPGVFNDSAELATRLSAPVNAWEDDKGVHVEVEVPGYTMEQIDVSLHQNQLTIKGERAEESEDKGREYIRRERRSGSFTRTFLIPSDVDASKVGATLEQGVLKVTLPKSVAAQARKIAITSK